jgi:hypothetical protein
VVATRASVASPLKPASRLIHGSRRYIAAAPQSDLGATRHCGDTPFALLSNAQANLRSRRL